MHDTTGQPQASEPQPGAFSQLMRPVVLREHALIADGERGAVVGPQGNIVWLCVPRWHDEPVFSSLIGGQGQYIITPTDTWHVWGGAYEPGSLIWQGKWVTQHSVIECENLLSYPASVDVAVMSRRIRAVSGTAKVSVYLRPASGFTGNTLSKAQLDDNGIWHGQVDDLYLRWQGAENATQADDGGLQFELQLAEGQEQLFTLELSRKPLPTHPVTPEEVPKSTRWNWQRTVANIPRPDRSDDIRQSYAVLTGMTSQDNGMVAAATMSLPEREHAHRDYDYRYCWIRDQCYAGQAVATLGPNPLLTAALHFITDRILEDKEELKPAYRVDGGPVPEQHDIGLPGYPGGSNIAGNWVRGQFQLDTFGEALNLYASAAQHDVMDASGWQAVRLCRDIIENHWQQPDAGVWELHDAHWTHSRLSCVAGLRSITRHMDSGEAASFEALADTIMAEISTTSVRDDGAWAQRTDFSGSDAALLLPLVRGAIDIDDPRATATLQAIRDELNKDGHIYRFQHGGKPLGEAEGSFTACGFMMVLAMAKHDELLPALHFYERARMASTSSGLFTEEFDVASHQLRGNLPQAFVHALFIEAALQLAPIVDSTSDQENI